MPVNGFAESMSSVMPDGEARPCAACRAATALSRGPVRAGEPSRAPRLRPRSAARSAAVERVVRATGSHAILRTMPAGPSTRRADPSGQFGVPHSYLMDGRIGRFVTCSFQRVFLCLEPPRAGWISVRACAVPPIASSDPSRPSCTASSGPTRTRGSRTPDDPEVAAHLEAERAYHDARVAGLDPAARRARGRDARAACPTWSRPRRGRRAAGATAG